MLLIAIDIAFLERRDCVKSFISPRKNGGQYLQFDSLLCGHEVLVVVRKDLTRWLTESWPLLIIFLR